jgi:hypothetical protein
LPCLEQKLALLNRGKSKICVLLAHVPILPLVGFV